MRGNHTANRGHGPVPELYSHAGQSLSASGWDQAMGLPPGTMRNRLRSGKTIAEALAMKPRERTAAPPRPASHPMRRAAYGSAANAVRRRLESTVIDGERVVVRSTTNNGHGWIYADTTSGDRWGRVRNGTTEITKQDPNAGSKAA